jgi:hypothetical protein
MDKRGLYAICFKRSSRVSRVGFHFPRLKTCVSKAIKNHFRLNKNLRLCVSQHKPDEYESFFVFSSSNKLCQVNADQLVGRGILKHAIESHKACFQKFSLLRFPIYLKIITTSFALAREKIRFGVFDFFC